MAETATTTYGANIWQNKGSWRVGAAAHRTSLPAGK
jgi:hypothetical protein